MKPRKLSLLFAFILGFVGFVTSFGAHIVAVNLLEYAKDVGIGIAMVGLLIAAYDFAEIIAKPVFGSIADQQGMNKTLLIGIGFFIGASLLYLVVPAQWLLGIRFLQGIGAAALSAVSACLFAVYCLLILSGFYIAFGLFLGGLSLVRTQTQIAQCLTNAVAGGKSVQNRCPGYVWKT